MDILVPSFIVHYLTAQIKLFLLSLNPGLKTVITPPWAPINIINNTAFKEN